MDKKRVLDKTHKYFLVSFEEDKSWMCIKNDLNVKNIELQNKTIEVQLNRQWYRGILHYSSGKILVSLTLTLLYYLYHI